MKSVITYFLFLFASTSFSNWAFSQSTQFQKIVVSEVFSSEGVSVADINKDGKLDIIAGAFWFKAPNWDKIQYSEDIRYDRSLKPFPKDHVFKVDDGYSNSFLNFSQDINSDGWVDIIKIGLPGEAVYWFENPKNKNGLWKSHFLSNSIGNESPLFEDVNLDGKKDIICNDSKGKKVVWLESPSIKNDSTWISHTISSHPTLGTHKYTHGLGFGDLNKDGRKDVIIKDGWWESPKDVKQENWAFHPLNLQFDAAQILIQDVNLDGQMDLLTSSAHDFGIWYHLLSDNGNKVETVLIDKQVSQTHSLSAVDFSKDKIMDFVVGKRYMAHNGKDPGEFEAAKLIWYEALLGKSPKWIAHEIDQDSGAGIHTEIIDMNKDGKKDVVISNKKGVFVFLQKKS
jgi:hypothetical protein